MRYTAMYGYSCMPTLYLPYMCINKHSNLIMHILHNDHSPQSCTSLRNIHSLLLKKFITILRYWNCSSLSLISMLSLPRLSPFLLEEPGVILITLDGVMESSLDQYIITLGTIILLLCEFQKNILILLMLICWSNLNTMDTCWSTEAVLFHIK